MGLIGIGYAIFFAFPMAYLIMKINGDDAANDDQPIIAEGESAEEWVPYEKLRMQSHDLKVSYRLYSHEEGGRTESLRQGYRTDFSYVRDDDVSGELFMSHPEFEDEEGQPILDRSRLVAPRQSKNEEREIGDAGKDSSAQN